MVTSNLRDKVKIIPLGGINEIGKNMTAFEYGNEIIVVDCGLAFPDNDMLGVDLVIPDVTYLKKNRSKVKALVLTHAHEDHIGAIPYIFRDLNMPIYCTKLTGGIVESKLSEHRMIDKVKITVMEIGSVFDIGGFNIEFIRTNHSIADTVALAIKTSVGVILHTGDFKIDTTPVSGKVIDLARLGQLGNEGVLVLMSESTNAERPGYTMSEKKVGQALDAQFEGCKERIIIATFASNIYRLQQILDAAQNHGRKVAICGRSMENISNVAMRLGYLNDPKKILIELSDINKYPRNKIVIVSTGSQGETMSALYRMAFGAHRQVQVTNGDKILISASPIPGNEKSVHKMINELVKRGADVVYEKMADIHVSGHACSEELKMMLSLIRPKFFVPIHGEYRHLKTHAGLAVQTGVDPKDIFILDVGKPLEVTKTSAKMGSPVPAGKVLVDGLGIGDVGTAVLRDRKHLSQDGLIVIVVTLDSENGIVIAGPDIVSRGFVYVKEAEDLMDGLKNMASKSLDKCMVENIRDWNTIKTTLKNSISEYLYKKTKRSPMILPVIMEI